MTEVTFSVTHLNVSSKCTEMALNRCECGRVDKIANMRTVSILGILG